MTLGFRLESFAEGDAIYWSVNCLESALGGVIILVHNVPHFTLGLFCLLRIENLYVPIVIANSPECELVVDSTMLLFLYF